ncbi:hypothetical protein DFH06DRAFT_1129511 [Mycena polygramma]|nr:hypothetical protein DFH06DRAFT_1129511 [Mycena polygramma]
MSEVGHWNSILDPTGQKVSRKKIATATKYKLSPFFVQEEDVLVQGDYDRHTGPGQHSNDKAHNKPITTQFQRRLVQRREASRRHLTGNHNRFRQRDSFIAFSPLINDLGSDPFNSDQHVVTMSWPRDNWAPFPLSFFHRGPTMDPDVVPLVRPPEPSSEYPLSGSEDTPPHSSPRTHQMSLPFVDPSDYVVTMFWRRISQLTTRTHDEQDNWIGVLEMHKQQDKTRCIPCRAMKIGCDRKTRFLFDMTKDTYFSTFDQFMKVFRNKPTASQRRPRKSSAKLRRLEDNKQNNEKRQTRSHTDTFHPQRSLRPAGTPTMSNQASGTPHLDHASLHHIPRNLRLDIGYVYDTMEHLEGVLLSSQGDSSVNPPAQETSTIKPHSWFKPFQRR